MCTLSAREGFLKWSTERSKSILFLGFALDFSFVCSAMASITARPNYPALLLLFIQNQSLLLLPETYQSITSHAAHDSFLWTSLGDPGSVQLQEHY